MDRQVIKPEQETSFYERTHRFELSVTLSYGQRLLTITMKDFVDWAIYEKEYSKEDIGKEIHQKMDVLDVYSAFAQTQPQCDEEMKEKQAKGNQVKKYQFGTVVENENGNIPCYKIERGGKITAYLSMLDMRSKKQAIYESNLILNKVRNMTEAQMESEKSLNEKNQIMEELKQEVRKERREKEELVKRVIKLEEKFEKVEEELKITNQKLEKKDAEQEQKIKSVRDELNERITLLESMLKSNKTELAGQNQEIRHELKQTKQELVKALRSNKTEANTKIKEVQQQLVKKLQLQNQGSLDKSEKIQEMSESIGDMTKLMTLSQAYSNQFKVDGYKVQLTGSSQTHYIFNSAMKQDQTTFTIRINKTEKRYIVVGVVDYFKQRNRRFSYNSGNAMGYGARRGYKFPQGVTEGDGFKQGDVVEVDVDRDTCTIKYIVNGITKATHSNSMLADSYRVFMPFVEMDTTGDCVEWLP